MPRKNSVFKKRPMFFKRIEKSIPKNILKQSNFSINHIFKRFFIENYGLSQVLMSLSKISKIYFGCFYMNPANLLSFLMISLYFLFIEALFWHFLCFLLLQFNVSKKRVLSQLSIFYFFTHFILLQPKYFKHYLNLIQISHLRTLIYTQTNLHTISSFLRKKKFFHLYLRLMEMLSFKGYI